jgi:hypothetical protein
MGIFLAPPGMPPASALPANAAPSDTAAAPRSRRRVVSVSAGLLSILNLEARGGEAHRGIGRREKASLGTIMSALRTPYARNVARAPRDLARIHPVGPG